MDYKTRKELNQLSKAVFGSTSKWQKFVNNGEAVPVTETVRVLNGETEEIKEEQRQLTYYGPNGGELPQFEVKHYTTETIKERMILIKTQKEQIRALIEKLRKEESEKREAEVAKIETIKVVESQSGSAIEI
jgi:hypothetical protein